MKAIQVGKDYNDSRSNAAHMPKLTYAKVPNDGNDWVDAENYLPISYDLVTVKIGEGYKVGWFTGNAWDGHKMELDEKVTHWKRVV